MALYLDTSALVKLVVAEPESAALRAWLVDQNTDLVTADLTRTELMRAARRLDPGLAVQVTAVLDTLTILRLDSDAYAGAGRLDPPTLRSLDALHLTAALHLGDDLDGLVCYDQRLTAAATQLGVRVYAPSG